MTITARVLTDASEATTAAGWTTAATVALAVAAIGLAGIAITTWQKARADVRTAWWARAQWALEQLQPPAHSMTPTALSERRAVALLSLDYLADTRLTGADEWEWLAEIASRVTQIPNTAGGDKGANA